MALYHPYYKNQVHVPSMSPRDSSTQVLRMQVFGVYVLGLFRWRFTILTTRTRYMCLV